MQNIRIELPKGVQDGKTSLSPSNPPRSNTGSPSISPKGAMMIGYGAMAAKRTYSLIVNEIKAGGNEQLATDISNATTLIGVAVGAVATGGLSLIPQAISGVTSEISRYRNNQRMNKQIEFERSVKGSLNNYLNGGGG